MVLAVEAMHHLDEPHVNNYAAHISNTHKMLLTVWGNPSSEACAAGADHQSNTLFLMDSLGIENLEMPGLLPRPARGLASHWVQIMGAGQDKQAALQRIESDMLKTYFESG
jgi:hypothetical protein